MQRKGLLVVALALLVGVFAASTAFAGWDTCNILRIGASGGMGTLQVNGCTGTEAAALNTAGTTCTLANNQVNQMMAVLLTAFANGKKTTIQVVACGTAGTTCAPGTHYYVLTTYVDQ